MSFDRDIHRRRSVRIPGYNYRGIGAYFVTVCTRERECMFGDIVDGGLRLNEYGEIVRDEWLRTQHIRSRVLVDKFIVMPNHFHGILIITDDMGGARYDVGARCNVPLRDTARIMQQTGARCNVPLRDTPALERFGQPTSDSIPTIIRLFKSASTKRINALRLTPGAPVWQRNYYEHVIRNDLDLCRIREYITMNPLEWETDHENPMNAYHSVR